MRFLLAAALLLISTTAFADDAVPNCDAYPDVPIKVTSVFEEPSYDYDVTLLSLQALARSGHAGIREGIVMGLTHYKPVLEVDSYTELIQLPDGQSCAKVGHVDVTIGYENVVVYIAKEIPPNTCGFDQIMGHEQKHIHVNRQILDAYAPLIQQKLQDYLKLNGVFREGNLDYAGSLVREKLKEIVGQLSQQLVNENQTRQQAVDSPQEYHRLSVSCNGQLQGVMGRYLGNER